MYYVYYMYFMYYMYLQSEERTTSRQIKNECNYTSAPSIRTHVGHRLIFSNGRTFRRKKAFVKPISRWQDAVWRHVADTELEDGGNEKRSLEKGDREGQGRKTGWSAVEEERVKRRRRRWWWWWWRRRRTRRRPWIRILLKTTPFSVPFPMVQYQ